MAMKLYSDTDIQAIADAIRGKNGSSDTYTVSQMAQAIDDIPSGGGGISLDGLANGTEPNGNITIPTATVLEEYAFGYRKGITKITAPNVTRIKQFAVTYVGQTSGYVIDSTSFPALNTVDNHAFRNSYASSIDIRSSSDILKNTRVFGDMPQLTTALFPNQTGVVGSQCFYSCSRLAILDIGKATSISANAFNGCPLSALIIRSTSVATLSDISAFNNTPLRTGGTGGTLYVPSSLISSYKSATNWSTILGNTNNQIMAIEGSIYEL